MTEHLISLHAELAHLTVRRRATIDEEELLLCPVSAQRKAQEPSIGSRSLTFDRFQDDSTRSVTEKDAGATVSSIHQSGHGLRTNDQRAFRAAARGEAICN